MADHRKRVAVIDDEAAIGELVHRVLVGDYDVDVYVDVEPFLATLEEGRSYDAILCDLYMQGISGGEIYETLAERWADQARVMIFMSGVSAAEVEKSIPTEAPRYIIEKPFEMEGLKAMVHRVVSGDER